LAVEGRCRRAAAVCGRDRTGEEVEVAVAGLWRMWKDLALLLLVCVIFQRGDADGGRETEDDGAGGRDMVSAADRVTLSPQRSRRAE